MVRPPFDDLDQATPEDPDGSTAMVFMLYASVMQAIQSVEQTVALLTMTTSIKPKTVSGASYRRQARKAMAAVRHVNQKVSATANVRELKDRIPDDLHAELEAFIQRRNFFAHRFFLQKMETTGERAGKFAAGTAMELFKTHREYVNLADKLQAHDRAIRASWGPVEPPPPDVQQWVDDVVQLLVRGRVRPEVLEEIQRRAAAKRAAEAGEDFDEPQER